MASAVLHIKDSYYFEVPKALWPSRRDKLEAFPDVWVKLDPDFQKWEAERLYDELLEPREWGEGGAKPLVPAEELPAESELLSEWEHWQHADHANFGKPLDVFLQEKTASLLQDYAAWLKADKKGRSGQQFIDYLRAQEEEPDYMWFAWRFQNEEWREGWDEARDEAGGEEAIEAYKSSHEWSEAKIAKYNKALSGKVLIPQPFGELRNFYEPESGFAISKFMIIEVVVALLLIGVFAWLARRVGGSLVPRGRGWNLLESVLLYMRDNVARPAIGGHDADKFVPLLWTIFLFVLGLNLMGMIPWVGAPTGAFGVTFGLAMVTFATVIVFGMLQFGVLGFFMNQIPSMDLPTPIAIIIKPMLLAIELAGLLIKHAVLAIRLLANMVAGHLVLLGIMGLAFGADAALEWAGEAVWQWGVTAAVAVLASTVFSMLELFVAFLQAFIFTFLSALFIGAAIHHH